MRPRSCCAVCRVQTQSYRGSSLSYSTMATQPKIRHVVCETLPESHMKILIYLGRYEMPTISERAEKSTEHAKGAPV